MEKYSITGKVIDSYIIFLINLNLTLNMEGDTYDLGKRCMIIFKEIMTQWSLPLKSISIIRLSVLFSDGLTLE